MTGRMRTVKPEFFQHHGLYEAEAQSGLPLRVAFAGLWTQCDREGRFEWRPRMLKLAILPYDPVDLRSWWKGWSATGSLPPAQPVSRPAPGCITSWSRHQIRKQPRARVCHPCPTRQHRDRLASSTRERRDTPREERDDDASTTREACVDHASGTRHPREGHAPAVELEGKGL